MIKFSSTDWEKLTTVGLTKSELTNLIHSSDIDYYLEFLELQGLSLIEKDGIYYPKQLFQKIEDISFCVVDIETNGSHFHKNQIIEIGAVIIENQSILDTFETLITVDTLPRSIAELTGISLLELQSAPSLKEVMHKFKIFLKDHILVAHPLKFDYEFISASFETAHFGSMLNLGICNIALAERTLSSAKYGLHYLNRTLGLEEDFKQHRAYNDAVITKDIFIKAIENLPENIVTVKDLMEFIKKGKKKPRAALVEV